jgi:hypothetical protein
MVGIGIGGGVAGGVAAVVENVTSLEVAVPSGVVTSSCAWYVVAGASPVSVAATGSPPTPGSNGPSAVLKPYAMVGP